MRVVMVHGIVTFKLEGRSVVVILGYRLTIWIATVVGKGWCFWGGGERRVAVALVVLLGAPMIRVSW